MHRVSPVRIHTELNVRNQMHATSFQDALNSSKVKKRVQIAEKSTVINPKKNWNNKNKKTIKNKTIASSSSLSRQKSLTNNANTLKKAKSLSPMRKNIHWCPPPGKTSKSNRDKSADKEDVIHLFFFFVTMKLKNSLIFKFCLSLTVL
jgi:hypothetical protein